MKHNTCILSLLSHNQLWIEFLHSPFPKWSSLCLLHYLQMPVLDAVYIDPNASSNEIVQIIEFFTELHKLENILIRSDGGRERGHYLKGGNSLKTDNALSLINNILSNNRAAIIMKPTNRFTNKIALNLHLDISGFFRLEILGPGFDVGDLNRGLLNPEISISVDNIDWFNHDMISPFNTTITRTPIERLREIRLLRIGEELLPAIGISSSGTPTLFAEHWLIQNGYNEIFNEQRPTIDFREIQKLYITSFILGSFYRFKVQWENLVISASVLGENNNLVFWDISNPKEKFSVIAI